MSKNVYIVGPIPKPMGGVSTYIYRLVNFFPEFFSGVIDIYSSISKESIPIKHMISPFENRGLSFIWLLMKTPKSKDDFIHFNFSSASALLNFAFLIKGRANWALMLHNGHLNLNRSILVDIIVKKSISKIDRFYYINENQYLFYKDNLGVKNDKLFKLDSYVPPLNLSDSDGCKVKIKEGYNKVALANGYFKPLYNFEFIIEACKVFHNVLFLIVVYGDSDLDYEKKIKSHNLKNLQIIDELSQIDFLALLASSDLYIRPNFIDSYGIAVADAISFSVPAIASDVCERASGSTLFKCGDLGDFLSKIEESLKCNFKPDNKGNMNKLREKYIKCYGIENFKVDSK